MDPPTNMASLFGIFLSAVETNQWNSYFYVSALTWCSYDIILSFNREVEHIWRSKLSFIKVLYLFLRYYTLIMLIVIVAVFTRTKLEVKTCQAYIEYILVGGSNLFMFALDLILLLRLLALYQRSKAVGVTLLILVLGTFGASMWSDVKLSKVLGGGVIFAPAPYRGCAVLAPSLKFMLVCYVPICALSLLFLGMTLYKLLENHQSLHGKLTWRSLYHANTLSPLMLAFIRDGSILFALTSVINFLRVIAFYVVHGPTQTIFVPWIYALYSYAGSHLVLNLRAAGKEGATQQSWGKTLSIHYLPGPASASHSGGTATFAYDE